MLVVLMYVAVKSLKREGKLRPKPIFPIPPYNSLGSYRSSYGRKFYDIYNFYLY